MYFGKMINLQCNGVKAERVIRGAIAFVGYEGIKRNGEGRVGEGKGEREREGSTFHR